MKLPVIYILDDDVDIVELVAECLQSCDVEIRKFTCPETFLTQFDGSVHGCVVMDIRMPNVDGIGVLQRISGWLPLFPVLFISGYADVPVAVSAMKNGAFDLIQKPFSPDELVKRVNRAIGWSTHIRERYKDSALVWASLQALTQREHEIMDLLLGGMSSREISVKLDISRYTVDHHRAHIMEKLKCPSLSGLTSIVSRAKALFEIARSPHRLGTSSKEFV